jgi:hypothetical protein
MRMHWVSFFFPEKAPEDESADLYITAPQQEWLRSARKGANIDTQDSFQLGFLVTACAVCMSYFLWCDADATQSGKRV